MDPLTHGITGALIGKAFFSGARKSNSTTAERAIPGAALICMLAALFPDVDVFFDNFVEYKMATLELHRGWTHSLVLLPVWAILLGALTAPVLLWVARRRNDSVDAPANDRTLLSVGAGAALVYAAGIFSHIVLDLATSFGTMIWSPISNARASWDLVFIIDLMLTGIVLVPQLLAWIYARRDGSLRRAVRSLALLSALLFSVFWLARRAGVPFAPAALSVIVAALAGILLGPHLAGAGFRISRAAWCRAGLIVLVAYYGVCAVAHWRALQRVDAFIEGARLTVEHRAALPMPPWLGEWSGQVRTSRGVFISSFNLRDAEPPKFHAMPDSPRNEYVETARRLPEIRTWLWFARFPVVRYFRDSNELHIVEFNDTRFLRSPNDPRPGAFQYRVILDDAQKVLWQGWAE